MWLYIHKSETPSSGTDRIFKVEWHGDKEEDSRNVTQVLAILEQHVCDGKSQAVSLTSTPRSILHIFLLRESS